MKNNKLISSIAAFVVVGMIVLLSACIRQERHDSDLQAVPEAEFVIGFQREPPFDDTVYDYVILNARYINPETGSDIEGMYIGILGDYVAAVTRRPLTGRNVIDATGLVAAPGFIDIDTYDPIPFGVRYKIADGVTTNLLMHGGAPDAAAWYAIYERSPPNMNYGISNFITAIRANLGYGINTIMTNRSDFERLSNIVEINILNGALGISMSPEYVPGLHYDDMLRLSEIAVKYGIATYYHLRYSTHLGENNNLKAVQEVIDIARQTGASVHIMHITSTGSTYVVEEAFDMIDRARDEGLDITVDIYPYDSWATYLNSARFSAGWQDRFGLTYSDLQVPNSSETLTEETFNIYRRQGLLVIANGSIPENEVQYALQKPYVFIASDQILGVNLNGHPRGAGSFSRTIGRYARELGVITLMDAIAKVSFLPAQRLESASADMKRKGRIEVGSDADIVLFDYSTIIDRATNDNVAVFSEGIKYVFINGKLVYENGVINELRAGKPIKNYLVHPEIRPQTQPFGSLTGYLVYDGKYFVSLADAASEYDVEYVNNTDGKQIFGNAELFVGLTRYNIHGQNSHLLHEPIVYRGKIFILIDDLEKLLH